MSYQPHLHKGGELYHFRTKGSKNGVSNTPGYRAVGKKAVGFLNAAGQYVYNNASKAVGSAGNWLSDRGRDVSNAASKARDYVTGGSSAKSRAVTNEYNARAARQRMGKNLAPGYVGDARQSARGDVINSHLALKNYQRDKSTSKGTAKTSNDYLNLVRNSKKLSPIDSQSLGREHEQKVADRMQFKAGRAARAKMDENNSKKRFEEKALDSYKSGMSERERQQEEANKINAYSSRAAADRKKYENSLAGKFDKAKDKLIGSKEKNWEHLNKARSYEGKAKAAAEDSKYLKPSTFFDKDNGYSGRDYAQQYGSKIQANAGKAAKERQAAKNETIGGKLDNLRKNATNAADNARKSAGNWLSDRGEDIAKAAGSAKETASKAISGAGKAAGRAAKSVGNFASTSFESAKKTVGEGASRAGDFISGLFGKKKPKKASKPTRSKK